MYQSQGSSYGSCNCLSSPECCCHWRVLWRTNSWRRWHIGSYRIIGGIQHHLPLMFWDTGPLLSRMSGRKYRGKPISTHSLRFSWRQPWGRLPCVLDRNKKGNMCVCVSVCTYASIWEYMCIYIMCAYICVCIYAYILCEHIMCACIYKCVWICVHIYKQNVYFCLCICIYIYYIYKQNWRTDVSLDRDQNLKYIIVCLFFLHYVEACRGTIRLRLIIHLESEEYRRAHLMIRTSKHTTNWSHSYWKDTFLVSFFLSWRFLTERTKIPGAESFKS